MDKTSRKWHQKKSLSTKDKADNDDDSLMHLKFWLNKYHSLLDDLEPFNFPDTGRGLKTLKDVKSDDILIKIPYDVLITTSTVAQSNVRSFLSESEHYSAQCLLSAFIIYETHLGKVSKWYHYINNLPRDLTNPDFCTRREKKLLPTFIIDYMNEFHKVQNDYQLLIRSKNRLSLGEKARCPHCNLHFNQILTFQKYKWAYYIVNTRAIYVDTVHIETNCNIGIKVKSPNNLALAPFLDLFNHDIHTTTLASLLIDENGCKFYQLTTLKPFHSGSQVFINYGAHNSLKLFVDYGFFISNNPLDEIYFNISDIEACLKVSKIKLNFITTNNLCKNMAFTREGINFNAKSVLFVISTKQERYHWCSKIYGNFFTSEDMVNICVAAKQILKIKKKQLMDHLINMKNIKHHTQCYAIAINIVEEYIRILSDSYNSCCTFNTT